MIAFGIASVGVRGPGLPDWESSKHWLAGGSPPDSSAARRDPLAARLGGELRRTTAAVRLAIAAADDAVRAWVGEERTPIRCVFASSSGDGPLLCSLLETLADPDRAVSPTQFHNSVHNAAAGYWSILRGDHSSALSLAAGDWTFGVGFLRSALECTALRVPVLSVAFDTPFLPPLDACRPLVDGFSAAFVLVPAAAPGSVPVSMRLEPVNEPTRVRTEQLRRVSECNPAAQSLSLLECLAGGGGTEVAIPISDQQTMVLEVAMC